MAHAPLFLLTLAVGLAPAQTLRPPAVPLITHDPYYSVWSMADRLTEEPTRHWTGAEQQQAGLARIDGSAWRFLGSWARGGPAMRQIAREVTPTRTIYRFEQSGVALELTFLTPALPDDLDLLSRPLTYVIFEARSTDGRPHQVSLHFDCGAQLAVNTVEQRVTWSRLKIGDLAVLRVGSVEQEVLSRSGDNLRIDWGYFYLAVPPQAGASTLATTQRTRQRRPAATRSRWRRALTWARWARSRCRATFWRPTTTCSRSSTSTATCAPGGGAPAPERTIC
jgi:hypothetical protein